ncbi:carbohydrate ABC transporter permease [Leifsonia sp. NPDC058194]|uniref:carbohydrate ABC transporter permease n=1 Tax=Leifsonia sp. NPDC058194 TaxID=3346374 RepID=UPI0036DF305C
MLSGITVAIAVTVGLPLAIWAYLRVSESVARVAGRSRKASNRVRALLWLLPGLVLAGVVLIYPLLSTLWSSFQDSSGFGLGNYIAIFTDSSQIKSVVNSLIWVAIVPVVVLILGLVFSVLSDRVKYQKIARMCIIAPTAISMTAATIVWASVYRFDSAGQTQTGLLNAIWTSITGAAPVAWTLQPPFNNAALMFIGVWAWLGYACLLLTSAVKAIPEEVVEAARIDGVSEWQLFRHITFPQIVPTMGIVVTVLVVWALKVFDIVYVLTQGNYGTSVLAMDIYNQLFVNQDLGKGSALAIVLLLIALPIIWFNVRNVRKDVGA